MKIKSLKKLEKVRK